MNFEKNIQPSLFGKTEVLLAENEVEVIKYLNVTDL